MRIISERLSRENSSGTTTGIDRKFRGERRKAKTPDEPGP